MRSGLGGAAFEFPLASAEALFDDARAYRAQLIVAGLVLHHAAAFVGVDGGWAAVRYSVHVREIFPRVCRGSRGRQEIAIVEGVRRLCHTCAADCYG